MSLVSTPASPNPELRFRDVLDAFPAAVYTTDADGYLTFFNHAAEMLAGRAPTLGEDRWCVSWKIYDADGAPMAFEDCPMAVTLREGVAVRGVEIIVERPDGGRVNLMPFPTPLRDAQGRVTGAVNMLVDITALKQSEQASYRLSAIVESSDDAIVSKDLNGTIVSWNRGAERLFGYSAEEAVGRPVTMLMFPEHQGEEPSILERIRRGERIDHYETVRRRKDGTSVDISLTVSPVKTSQGRIIGASKIARDISERKRADEQRTLLIHELNHRVKNTLATVQSLVMQTLRNTERSGEARALLDARLAALSRAHDLLTAQSWEGAGLRDIVRRALEPFRTSAERVTLAGPDVLVTPKQAVALSIALHELATNAAKYGALSGERGNVGVRWTIAPDGGRGMLELTWTESGGPPVAPPTRTGFGMRLIERSLASDLGGATQVRYLPEGVVAEISTPLEPISGH